MIYTSQYLKTQPPAARRSLSRQARKAETRQALIEAAAELFAARGIEATTVEQIAARVGLTKGAVYGNFASKAALIDVVIEETSRVVPADVMFDADRDLAARLAGLGQQLADLIPEVGPRTTMLDLEFELYLARNPARARVEREENDALRRELVAKLEATAGARGEALPLAGAALLTALRGMARGMGLERLNDPAALPGEAIAAMFALLGRGIVAWQAERQHSEDGGR